MEEVPPVPVDIAEGIAVPVPLQVILLEVPVAPLPLPPAVVEVVVVALHVSSLFFAQVEPPVPIPHRFPVIAVVVISEAVGPVVVVVVPAIEVDLEGIALVHVQDPEEQVEKIVDPDPSARPVTVVIAVAGVVIPVGILGLAEQEAEGEEGQESPKVIVLPFDYDPGAAGPYHSAEAEESIQLSGIALVWPVTPVPASEFLEGTPLAGRKSEGPHQFRGKEAVHLLLGPVNHPVEVGPGGRSRHGEARAEEQASQNEQGCYLFHGAYLRFSRKVFLS